MVELEWSRRVLQMGAIRMLDDRCFLDTVKQPGTGQPEQRLMHTLRLWAKSGAQSVTMPDTFAAALAATNSGSALLEAKLPWQAFEVQLPPGLVVTPQGSITSFFVAELPRNDVLQYYGGLDFMMLYVAGTSVAYTTDVALDDLLNTRDMEHFDELRATDGHANQAFERRVFTVLKQVAAGVILSIEEARAVRHGAYSPKPMRRKRDRVKPNQFVLGKPLTLDCRPAVRDYVAGVRNSPSVRTMVRGHWVHQPCGPGHSQRRVQWRRPHIRGDGPMLVRPVRIGSTDEAQAPNPQECA